MVSDSPVYKGNILFVDDSRVNLMVGRKMLSHYGLTVTTAENGLEAVELCKNNVYQLIFMDLEMPEVGGLVAATLIREKKLSFAPIIALTGNEGEYIRMLCREAHMNGFIEKPLKKEKLVAVLNRVFLSEL